MTRRAAIYARISNDREGRELGVERQRESAEALIEQRGWSLVGTWTENDVTASGKKPRPQFRDMLAAVRRGEVDAIVAWNLHRLTRNARDRLELVETCREGGVIVALVRGSDLDPNTASGRLHMGILGEVAQHEIDELADRVRAQKQQAVAHGWYRGGRRPFGYEADGVSVRPDEAAIVVEATKRALIGESLHAITRDLNARGVPTSTGVEWKPPALREVLLRARNAGLIEHDGHEAGEAVWPAIVEPAVWRNLRRLLTSPDRRPPRSADEKWLGSGVFECGVCADGTTVKGATTRSRSSGGGYVAAYACRRGRHLTRIAAPVDEFVSELVIGWLSKPEARSLLVPEEQRVDVEMLHARREDVTAQQVELAQLFARRTITGAQLAAATHELQAELGELDAQLAAATAGSPLTGFLDTDDVRAAWEAATVARRKAVLRAVMTVTIEKAPRGRPAGWTSQIGAGYFDPRFIRIEWKV